MKRNVDVIGPPSRKRLGVVSGSSGGLVGVGVGVGCGLGVVVATRTGDWSWMPIMLAACIALGAVAASRTRRS